MNKIISLVILLLCFAVHAQSPGTKKPESHFAEGLKAGQDGQFDQAGEYFRQTVAYRKTLQGMMLQRNDPGTLSLFTVVDQLEMAAKAALCLNILEDIKSKKIKKKEGKALFKSLHLSDQSQFDAALKEGDKAFRKYGENPRVLLARGQIYLAQTEANAALADFRSALEIDPALGLAHYYLGRAYELKELPEMAFDAYNAALASDQQLAEARIRRAPLAVLAGKFETAIGDYNQLLPALPHGMGFYHRGFAYLSTGNYSAAIADLSAALELSAELDLGKAVEAYYNRGGAYYQTGQYELAVDDFYEVTERDSTFAEAFYSRGLAYAELQLYDEALFDFTHALTLGADSAKCYFQRGRTYHKKRKYSVAISDYQEAIARDSGNTIAYYYKAFALDEASRHRQARAAYRAYLDIAPEDQSEFINYAKRRVRSLR